MHSFNLYGFNVVKTRFYTNFHHISTLFKYKTQRLKARLKHFSTSSLKILCFTGCVAFIGMATYFLSRPSIEVQFQEKLVFAAFFMGAILCLGMSFAFHTMCCHSEVVGKLFSKYVFSPIIFGQILNNILDPLRLDYCGIAMLIMGSFVPWLYYGFYCDFQPKVIYLSVTILLGISSIVVSLWDKFSEPKYRSLRAGACFVFCFCCDPTAMRFFQGFS